MKLFPLGFIVPALFRVVLADHWFLIEGVLSDATERHEAKTGERRESNTDRWAPTLAARTKATDCCKGSGEKGQCLIKLSRKPGWMRNAEVTLIVKACVL